MANSFNFTGKIALGKDSEKFHPVDRREFIKSGWMNTTVKFSCLSGNNRILCMTQGGKWKNDSKNVIKTLGKSTTGDNGKATKGEKIDIPWDKRFDADQIEQVAGFKKFVCDTGDIKMRYKLQNLIEAFKKGEPEEEAMEEVGIYNIDDAQAALDKSLAKKREFLSEWDFAEHVAKVAASEKFKNKLFHISGSQDVQYSAEKDRFYVSYHVNRIYLAADDAEPSTEFKIDFYYGEDAWDDSQYDETGKCYINGWVSYYDTNLKKNGFMPTTVTVKEDDKKVSAIKRKFDVDDGIKQLGLTLKVIEGAEVVELTLDMLTEDEREDIECGLLDFEDLKRERGNKVIGDRVSELRFVKLTPKKSTVQDTLFSADDMHAAKVDVIEEAETEIDIFAEAEDDDDL